MQHADRDTNIVIQEEINRKTKYIAKIKHLFRDISGGSSEDLSLEEFTRQLQNPELYAFASSLEIDTTDAEQFFRMLSNDGEHRVNIETLCGRVHEAPWHGAE